ncbi:MAG TPA: hypothetical protein VLG50_08140 [Candidatus Saccharimonadales bacterium]|nr:hypothetical protein [Candidatus Saccharimonadales bacterium]
MNRYVCPYCQIINYNYDGCKCLKSNQHQLANKLIGAMITNTYIDDGFTERFMIMTCEKFNNKFYIKMPIKTCLEITKFEIKNVYESDESQSLNSVEYV